MSEKIEPYKDIALIYDEVRPSYPEQLIKDIIEATNIKPNNTLLEIGAGTVKATVQFAERRFKIHAIEIGKDMGVDGLDDKTIQYMDEEIKSEIDKNGGCVGTIFDYSLYITKRKFA